jgi:Domain of unknown function (DUF1992)
MTERKPPEVSFETWVDKEIRLARERGDFDNLPGEGKPLPGASGSDDELWWVKNYIRREGLSSEALLPTPLRLRREIERLPDTVRDLGSERMVRDVVDQLNLRIVDWLRAPVGPHVRIGPVDADEVVRRWRADRAASPSAEKAHPATTDDKLPRTRWWRRITGRRRNSS